ncbi:hypothetical protein WI665_19410 [Vibrio cholerae]
MPGVTIFHVTTFKRQVKFTARVLQHLASAGARPDGRYLHIAGETARSSWRRLLLLGAYRHHCRNANAAYATGVVSPVPS